MRQARLVGAVIIMACGPGRPNQPGQPTMGESTSGPPDPSTSSLPPHPATTSTAPTTTAANTTTPVDTDSTSGEAGTSTTEISTSTSDTTGSEPCVDTVGMIRDMEVPPVNIANCDEPQLDWDEPHPDCFVFCSTATQIHGAGPAAGLPTIDRMAFGVEHSVCASGMTLRRFRLGPLAAPSVTIYTTIECALDPWIGVHEVTGRLADDTEISAVMTIDSYAGDWQSVDPVDPPRLLGKFTGDLVGPFEALHCGKLDLFANSCGE